MSTIPTVSKMPIPEQYTKSFSNDEINEMPLRRYEGPVTVVRTPEQKSTALNYLGRQRLLGFDTETRPNFRKGRPPNLPSLIQLAGEEQVYIFQLGLEPMCPGLTEILADSAVIKTGVSVHDDVKDLQKLSAFTPAGFIDLGDISHEVGMQTHGLRNLAANLLGFRISKSVQCSNWAKQKLTQQQVTYAATDAWVSREIYLAMHRLGLFNGNRP